MGNSIKLIALDIDGVMAKSRGGYFTGRITSVLQKLNDMAEKGGNVPPVTVITGRPATYVEAVMQFIHGFVPAVFEHGTGIYDQKNYRFFPHPDLKAVKELALIREIIIKEFVEKGLAMLQGGKEYTISLFSRDKVLNRQLAGIIMEKAKKAAAFFDFVYSSDSLNITPKGFDKGTGIEFLSSLCGVKTENILGVGDSPVDIPFMARCGFSAAPANAGEEVKAAAIYCSGKSHAEGLEDILAHFGILDQAG